MKKLYINLFVLITSVVIFSCDRERHFYDGPSLVQFANSSSDYFVQSTNNEFEVLVGLTAAASESKTFDIVVVDSLSTAEEGVHFTLESQQITFGAGETLASLSVTGNFDALADGSRTVVFALQDNPDAASFRQTFELNLIQFCEYDQDFLVGEYTVNSEFWGFSYPVNVVAGADEFTYVIEGLYDIGVPNAQDITFVINQVGEIEYTATVETQVAFDANTPVFAADYGPLSVTGTGAVNTCGEFALNLTFTVGAGSFGSYSEVLIKN
ncbi:hypothetical protein MATR_32860 [Marivirga tractuosa]|uniref:Calx-beta domain-containing protein n=1 Tax=Marivirga tractuosa (strain ATCC 23168 / DSM 4126 / NBRC 15989 / NCIMB 1408 / VKM B-1430 / H-43) TaxID=643867 RepID=E4TSE8_MARTH|nr:hypothetical protein [Marivirga tractuosa]ADR22865.1 hypothetical protein Ftrac_2889 [Marivirga tractuosa DSM 4126]BDD16461.1 hypothetical protein MATR_32860 [Marivirga tractuosa]